jgi:hypothetical protein
MIIFAIMLVLIPVAVAEFEVEDFDAKRGNSGVDYYDTLKCQRNSESNQARECFYVHFDEETADQYDVISKEMGTGTIQIRYEVDETKSFYVLDFTNKEDALLIENREPYKIVEFYAPNDEIEFRAEGDCSIEFDEKGNLKKIKDEGECTFFIHQETLCTGSLVVGLEKNKGRIDFEYEDGAKLKVPKTTYTKYYHGVEDADFRNNKNVEGQVAYNLGIEVAPNSCKIKLASLGSSTSKTDYNEFTYIVPVELQYPDDYISIEVKRDLKTEEETTHVEFGFEGESERGNERVFVSTDEKPNVMGYVNFAEVIGDGSVFRFEIVETDPLVVTSEDYLLYTECSDCSHICSPGATYQLNQEYEQRTEIVDPLFFKGEVDGVYCTLPFDGEKQIGEVLFTSPVSPKEVYNDYGTTDVAVIVPDQNGPGDKFVIQRGSNGDAEGWVIDLGNLKYALAIPFLPLYGIKILMDKISLPDFSFTLSDKNKGPKTTLELPEGVPATVNQVFGSNAHFDVVAVPTGTVVRTEIDGKKVKYTIDGVAEIEDEVEDEESGRIEKVVSETKEYLVVLVLPIEGRKTGEIVGVGAIPRIGDKSEVSYDDAEAVVREYDRQCNIFTKGVCNVRYNGVVADVTYVGSKKGSIGVFDKSQAVIEVEEADENSEGIISKVNEGEGDLEGVEEKVTTKEAGSSEYTVVSGDTISKIAMEHFESYSTGEDAGKTYFDLYMDNAKELGFATSNNDWLTMTYNQKKDTWSSFNPANKLPYSSRQKYILQASQMIIEGNEEIIGSPDSSEQGLFESTKNVIKVGDVLVIPNFRGSQARQYFLSYNVDGTNAQTSAIAMSPVLDALNDNEPQEVIPEIAAVTGGFCTIPDDYGYSDDLNSEYGVSYAPGLGKFYAASGDTGSINCDGDSSGSYSPMHGYTYQCDEGIAACYTNFVNEMEKEENCKFDSGWECCEVAINECNTKYERKCGEKVDYLGPICNSELPDDTGRTFDDEYDEGCYENEDCNPGEQCTDKGECQEVHFMNTNYPWSYPCLSEGSLELCYEAYTIENSGDCSKAVADCNSAYKSDCRMTAPRNTFCVDFGCQVASDCLKGNVCTNGFCYDCTRTEDCVNQYGSDYVCGSNAGWRAVDKGLYVEGVCAGVNCANNPGYCPDGFSCNANSGICYATTCSSINDCSGSTICVDGRCGYCDSSTDCVNNFGKGYVCGGDRPAKAPELYVDGTCYPSCRNEGQGVLFPCDTEEGCGSRGFCYTT